MTGNPNVVVYVAVDGPMKFVRAQWPQPKYWAFHGPSDPLMHLQSFDARASVFPSTAAIPLDSSISFLLLWLGLQRIRLL